MPVTPWVDYTLIYGLDFFGSPAPRVEGVSGDTHYRYTSEDWLRAAIFHADDANDPDTYIPIPGLAATVRTPANASAKVDVMCNFYMYTVLGNTSILTVLEGTQIGVVQMFSGTNGLSGTARPVYATAPDTIFGRKNFSMIAGTSIAAGTRNLWVGFQMDTAPITPQNTAAQDEPQWKHIFVDVRSMVINVHALHA
jgi:hypothetical protein